MAWDMGTINFVNFLPLIICRSETEGFTVMVNRRVKLPLYLTVYYGASKGQ